MTIRRREQVGDRLRSLRRGLGLSQEALGALIGLDRRSIGTMENGVGSVTVDAVLDLAEAMRVPVTWFFTDDWTQPPGLAESLGLGGGVRGGTAPRVRQVCATDDPLRGA